MNNDVLFKFANTIPYSSYIQNIQGAGYSEYLHAESFHSNFKNFLIHVIASKILGRIFAQEKLQNPLPWYVLNFITT